MEHISRGQTSICFTALYYMCVEGAFCCHVSLFGPSFGDELWVLGTE